MTKQEAQAYYSKLEEHLQQGGFDIEMNNDRVHNSVIMRLMLDKSNSICMYCGEMSVFRDSFYKHIDNDFNNKDSLGRELKGQLVDSMNEFINRDNTELQIILEKKLPEFPLSDLIFADNFYDAVKTGKIKLFYLNPEIIFNTTMSHFSFTPKVIRMEKDRKERSAICAVNAPEALMTDYQSHFKNLKEAAIPFGI